MKNAFNLILISLIAVAIAFSQDSFLNVTVALEGTVYNQVTKLPETCNIMVTDKDDNRVTATRSMGHDGSYYLSGLKPGVSYKVTLKKKNFLEESIQVDVPKTARYYELSHDFLIKPKKNGTKIPISVPPFELHKPEIRYGAEYFLSNWANVMKNNPNVKFKIISYPDSDSDPRKNKEYTTERAKNLQKYFATKGIDIARIQIQGNDKTDPMNQPPKELRAKGKRYIGTTYIEITSAN